MPNGLPPAPLPQIKAAMLELATVLYLLYQCGNIPATTPSLVAKLETEAHRLRVIIEGGLP